MRGGHICIRALGIEQNGGQGTNLRSKWYSNDKASMCMSITSRATAAGSLIKIQRTLLSLVRNRRGVRIVATLLLAPLSAAGIKRLVLVRANNRHRTSALV